MKKLIFTIFIIPLLLVSSMSSNVFAYKERNIQDEIILSVLVDRYNNGRQAPSEQVDIHDPYTYNGGDIQGITDRLDQIQEAGFTSISISPIMENANRGYHGYWIEDFYEVEEEFGSLDDLKTLVKEAHDRDIKIILELVTNYVAKTSPLVDDTDKADWFKDNNVTPIPATEWLDDVYVLDQTNEQVQDYLLDVASFWMKAADIDGFTLHAADQSDPTFLAKLTKQLKQKDPNFYFLATTLQEDGDTDFLYDIEDIDVISNPQLFTAMNEVLIEPDHSASSLFDTWKEYGNDRDLLYVDNMNTARFSNNFADKGRNAITTWYLALGYLYLAPGVPIIYQGSTVPMYGPGYPENQYLVDFISQDQDLEHAFEKMASLRDQFPPLVYGDFEQVATDEGFSLFKRTFDGKSVFVGINNDSESRVVHIDGLGSEVQLKGLLHDDTIRENKDGDFLIGMERESVEVFIIQANIGFNWTFIGFVAGVFILFVGGVIILMRKQKKREQANK